jgi:polysaccharide chain length determinant protein (PEP-CTERM system associated)
VSIAAFSPSFLVKYFAAEFWARRWLMFAIGAILCGVGWTIVAQLPNRYSASARVYVDTQSLINPLMKGMTVQPDLNEQVDIMRRTLLSRPNLEQVLRMTDLDLTVNTDIARERLLQQLQERINVEAQQERLFLITYEDTEPRLAHKVVDSILTIFVERNLGNTRKDMDQSRRFIDRQIAEHEERLRKAESEVAAFKRAHAEELGSREHYAQAVQNLEMQIHELSTELDAAAWKRDQLKIELARTPRTATSRTAGGKMPSAAARVSELQQKLNDLLLRYTDGHPDVVATKRALAAAQMELAQGGSNDQPTATALSSPNPGYTQIEKELSQLELESSTTRRRLEASEKDLADAKQRLADVPEVELQLGQMNRDYEVLRQNYSQLIERREAAKMALDIGNETTGVEFRVVDPPTVPAVPSGPNRILLFSGVLLGAVGAGIGVALILIRLKESFATITQVKEAFGIPVLGSISLVRSPIWRHVRLVEASVLACSWAALLVVFSGLAYYFGHAGEQPIWMGPIVRHLNELRSLVL